MNTQWPLNPCGLHLRLISFFLAGQVLENGALMQREIVGCHLWKDSHQSEDIVLFPQTKDYTSMQDLGYPIGG